MLSLLLTFSYYVRFASSIPRILLNGYCAAPDPVYPQYSDADLLQAHFIVRHGARTPLHKLRESKTSWEMDYTEQISQNNQSNQGVKVNVGFGKSISGGNEIYGQLLPRGVKQLNRIGQKLRNFFINRIKFLPNFFVQSNNFINFRTTNTNTNERAVNTRQYFSSLKK